MKTLIFAESIKLTFNQIRKDQISKEPLYMHLSLSILEIYKIQHWSKVSPELEIKKSFFKNLLLESYAPSTFRASNHTFKN